MQYFLLYTDIIHKPRERFTRIHHFDKSKNQKWKKKKVKNDSSTTKKKKKKTIYTHDRNETKSNKTTEK